MSGVIHRDALTKATRERRNDVMFSVRHVAIDLIHRSRKIRAAGADALERRSPRLHELVSRPFSREAEAEEPLPEYGSTVDVDGITMRIDPRMSEFNIRKLLAGRHTSHERELLSRALRADDVVMELGGGIGMVAIHCAKELGPGRVHSYEANPELESLIRDNYALNDVSPELNVCMVGREQGERTFYVSSKFSRSSTAPGVPDGTPVSVPVVALAPEMARVQPTVMVVDIQGGEKELLEHLDLRGLRTLLIEFHAGTLGLSMVNTLRRHVRRAAFTETARSGQSFLYERAPTA